MPEEAKYLLFKASAAYPNQIELEDETIALWIERLASLPFELGDANLNFYIDNQPKWFPSIADIIRNDLQQTRNHDTLKLETNEHFALLANWSTEDSVPPDGFWENVRKKLRGEQA